MLAPPSPSPELALLLLRPASGSKLGTVGAAETVDGSAVEKGERERGSSCLCMREMPLEGLNDASAVKLEGNVRFPSGAVIVLALRLEGSSTIVEFEFPKYKSDQ